MHLSAGKLTNNQAPAADLSSDITREVTFQEYFLEGKHGISVIYNKPLCKESLVYNINIYVYIHTYGQRSVVTG